MSAHVEWHDAGRAIPLFRTPLTTWDGRRPGDPGWDEEDAPHAAQFGLVIDCQPENVAVFVGSLEQLHDLALGILTEVQQGRRDHGDWRDDADDEPRCPECGLAAGQGHQLACSIEYRDPR